MASPNEGFVFNAERPHFFKVILDESIRLKKLGIPKKFVQNYGNYLSSPVILKVPSGLKWNVEIVKSNGEIWLHNGWPEFVEYFSISHGSFLVFEYEMSGSDSEFNVIIFDKSCTEIDYPFSFSIEGDNPETRPNSLDGHIQEPISMLDEGGNLKSLISLGKERLNRTHTKKKALGIAEEKANSIQTTSFNIRSHNPSFRIVIQPSHVNKRNVLVIPRRFASEHLNQSGDAILNLLDGRTWPVKYYSKTRFGITKTRIQHFGWNKFVEDIHLKVGDICVFELIDHVKTIFRVFKNTRCTKKSLEKESSDNAENLSFSNLADGDKKFSSGNPSFQAQISSGCLRGSPVNVPNSFLKNVDQGTKYTMLRVNNRCWPVKLIINSSKLGTGLLSEGWSAFARENSLKVGDVCTFGLITNGETPLVSVSIIRTSGICVKTNGDDKLAELRVPKVEETSTVIPVNHQSLPLGKRKEKSSFSFSQPHKKTKNIKNFTNKIGNGTNPEALKQIGSLPDQKNRVKRICTMERPHVTLKERSKDIDEARSSCQSENPTFQFVMHPSHVDHHSFKPDVPTCFAKKYMKRKDGNAVLNSLDGRKWSIRYWTRLYHGVIRTKMNHSDWKKFVRDNHLRVGDICTFELIDSDKTVFKFIISKGKNKESVVKERSIREGVQKPSFSSSPEAANEKSNSGNPIFQVTMTSKHIDGSNVHVPNKFITFLENGTYDIKLQLGNRFWPVKLYVYQHHFKSSLCAGWISFARDNCLKKGDICSFELIDTQNLLVKVSISRNV